MGQWLRNFEVLGAISYMVAILIISIIMNPGNPLLVSITKNSESLLMQSRSVIG